MRVTVKDLRQALAEFSDSAVIYVQFHTNTECAIVAFTDDEAYVRETFGGRIADGVDGQGPTVAVVPKL